MVFVYFDYKEYHSIKKWMQRHPEYAGALFCNDGFYIAKFDIDATDPEKVAYFFNYFSKKDVEIFKMKKICAKDILQHFTIWSYRPFRATPKTHADSSPHPLFSGHPVRNSSLPSEGKQPSGAVFSSSGDSYEYYPRKIDYEGD